MLETIRQFAGERLAESREEEPIRRRQAEFFLTLAESANLCSEATAAGGSARYDFVLPERENIVTVLEWFLAAGEIEAATRLAVSLEEFWLTNDPMEGRRWLSQLLERGSEIPPELHVRAIRCLGESLYIVGDYSEGGRLIEQSLEEYVVLRDDWGVAQIKLRQAQDAARRGDLAAARALCEEALESDRSPYNEAQVTRTLGGIAFGEGRPEEAIALLDKSAALADQVNFRWWQAGALEQAGEYALILDRPEDARPRIRKSLQIKREIGDRQGTCYGLTLLAWTEAISGAATASGPELEVGRGDGRRMTLEEAVAYALADQM